MKYCYSTFIEEIGFQPDNTHESMSYIVTKRGFDLLTVTCSWDLDVEYLFALKDDTDYELVRLAIMETIDRCKKTEEVLDCLTEMFHSRFADSLVA